MMAKQHRAENLWTLRLLDVQPTDHLLEIGFGPGFAIQQIAPHLSTGKITGLDFSAAMVRSASRRNARYIRAGRAEIFRGEVNSLPFANNIFDKVYSINSLYFWSQPEIAFAQIKRVLRPNGMAIITFLPLERWDHAPASTDQFRPYASHEVQALLTQTGYSSVRVESAFAPEHRSSYSIIAHKPPAQGDTSSG